MVPKRSHLCVIVFLPFVSEYRPNYIPRIFNDHLPGLNGFLAEQTSAMNRRPAENQNTINQGQHILTSSFILSCLFFSFEP